MGTVGSLGWGLAFAGDLFLSPFLFVVVMEVLSQEIREGLPVELLCADDLVLIAESMDGLKEKIMRWKECVEVKGLSECWKDEGDDIRTGLW